MSPLPLITKPKNWPEIDRAHWAMLFVKGDLFDDAGGGAHWSAGTRAKLEQTYGHWLSFLARSGQLDLFCAPAERITRDTVRLFHNETLARVSVISISSQLADLCMIARPLDPAADWAWLRMVSDRYRRRQELTQLKPRPGVSSSEIYRWALKEIGTAEKMESDGRWERSIRFRDGLMVGLLIARPVRLRAFINIEIGKHLAAQADGFTLQFKPEDMKDRKSRTFSVPAGLVGPMSRYLTEHRPELLRGAETGKLWISRRGTPLSRDGFQQHLHDITLRGLGVALRPHAFRHVAATSIAEDDPEHVNIIASLLGHATLATSERHYNRASGVTAASAFQSMIRDRRHSTSASERQMNFARVLRRGSRTQT
ncbi:tyrosine-type recombinase/integrase [Aureimonas leprariae]|uniref:Tyrosine-type recombinase/integrase n=1 Tax=Plantimonas leprariae TaxID=2615207 RepID=A0A7V7PMD1_9HYPH|nr:tyrosine-type recombinase/integrase [Aureimonas leprariae]KAB0677971.1 tyrosine-type recombinase/integrase [Aureimonas leprariae]